MAEPSPKWVHRPHSALELGFGSEEPCPPSATAWRPCAIRGKTVVLLWLPGLPERGRNVNYSISPQLDWLGGGDRIGPSMGMRAYAAGTLNSSTTALVALSVRRPRFTSVLRSNQPGEWQAEEVVLLHLFPVRWRWASVAIARIGV